MRSVLMLSAFVMGLGSASAAFADVTPAVDRPDQSVAVDTNTQAATNAVENDIQPVATERVDVRGHRSSAPLRGEAAWFIAGAAGALVPLVLFALPALWLAWFGPFAPIAFLVAIGVGTVATGLGGAAAWAISALFSDMKSGFLMPILASAAVGLGATFVSGLAAAFVIWAGVGISWLASGARNWVDAVRPNWRNPFGTVQGVVMLTAVSLGFLIWGGGVLTAAIGGPMVAAFMYRAAGTPKYVEDRITVENRDGTYNSYGHTNTNDGTYDTYGR